jgi:uncharacterized protein
MDITGAKDFILHKQEQQFPPLLTYHSVAHVLDVYEAVNRHIASAGITGDDALMLQTAALFHDSGFTVVAHGHEAESCKIARETLPQFGYNPNQIDTICGMIMATQIPQTPHTPLEEILADADLDYLGREDFAEISGRLFTELKNYGLPNNENEWNKMQATFFEAHHYFTPQAALWRNALKQQNLDTIKSNITS